MTKTRSLDIAAENLPRRTKIIITHISQVLPRAQRYHREEVVLANLSKFTPCGGAEAVASLRCLKLSVHSEPMEQVRT